MLQACLKISKSEELVNPWISLLQDIFHAARDTLERDGDVFVTEMFLLRVRKLWKNTKLVRTWILDPYSHKPRSQSNGIINFAATNTGTIRARAVANSALHASFPNFSQRKPTRFDSTRWFLWNVKKARKQRCVTSRLFRGLSEGRVVHDSTRVNNTIRVVPKRIAKRVSDVVHHDLVDKFPSFPGAYVRLTCRDTWRAFLATRPSLLLPPGLYDSPPQSSPSTLSTPTDKDVSRLRRYLR